MISAGGNTVAMSEVLYLELFLPFVRFRQPQLPSVWRPEDMRPQRVCSDSELFSLRR